MPTLTVYGRPECHLCEEMLAGLQALLTQGFVFSVEYIDIDARDELRALYGKRIPVLKVDGEELCQYFLDEEKLKQRLQRNPP